MKKLAAIGALSLMASSLFAQGNNAAGQTKDAWEEINFEFNSSILSDGYPSLLRLADLLNQHKDYKVRITGHTDYVGSSAYNDKLAVARAEAVKSFLVKYGAADSQLSTSGEGKRNPEVDNKTNEGRFMNRRVVLAVTDGNGRLIKEGTIGEVLPAMTGLDALLKKQQECCDQILKRLDKLDDILAALKALQGENDRLKTELGDLRNQQNGLKDQVNGLAKPVTGPEVQKMVDTGAQNAATQAAAKVEDNEAARRKALANVGINLGPAFGTDPKRPGVNSGVTASAHAQFFTPFGAAQKFAVQAQGEYMYYPGRQEGQFDAGLIDRVGDFQAGAFASFKYLNMGQFQTGGALGQGSVLLDYIFGRGRIGFFGTKGFKNYAVLNSVTLAPGAYQQTYARIVDQAGIDGTVAAWTNAYIEGNLGILMSHQQENKPGFNLKLVQPIREHLAFTAEVGYNETFLSTKNSGRVAFGLLFGGLLNPHDFSKVKTPVPMDIPRIRYELGTRRVGSSPPIADAGPNQLNVNPGTITLDGSGSYDPLGLTLTYSWVQIQGPAVTLSAPTAVKTTFTAAAGQTYAFRLTVKNTDGLQAAASTQVSTVSPSQVRILQFSAAPTNITAGQTSTLNWVVENATTVNIQPTLGSVDAHSGSSTVSPSATTTYTLTATGPSGSITATATVTVGTVAVGNPQILRFEANPVTIAPGQTSTLSWTTNGASTVSISGLGNEPLNGSVSTGVLNQTTTFILTATSSDGRNVTSPVTVTVTPGSIPQVVVFVANPQTIDAGQSTKVCWQVNGASSISITPGIGSNLNANDCATVSPQATTTYTLTATNATGQIQANTTVNVGQVRIISFTATPPFSPVQGAPVVLAWQTQNATSVVVVGADLQPQTLPVNGSLTINPMQNGTYTLTAYGPGGQTTSVSISIFVR